MPSELSTYYTKREFIGDSEAESLLNKAITNPEEKDTLIKGLESLLDESGKVLTEKKQGKLEVGFKKFGFNFRMFFSRIFRTAFAKNFDTAVKTLNDIKAYVLTKRADATDEQKKLQEMAKHAAEIAEQVFEAQKAAGEAKIAALKQTIQELDASIADQQTVKSKASENLKEAEKAFTAAGNSVTTLTQAKLDHSERKTNLENFLTLLEEGMNSNWPWLTQLDLRGKLREAYKDLKQGSYPEREFGEKFNNSKAEELKKLITADLKDHPQITRQLEEQYITAINHLRTVEGNKNSATTEFNAEAAKLKEMENQKAEQKAALEDLQLQFTTSVDLVAPPAAKGEPRVEKVAVVEVPQVTVSKKDEMLQAIRDKVGGPEGEKLAQLFDALIKGESVKSFSYDAASKKHTVEFTGVQRVWVNSSDVKGGVVMTLGDNRAKSLKFTLSQKQMEIDYDSGIGSYGNLSAFAKSAVIVKLRVDGDSVASTGKVGKFGGTKDTKFGEMLDAWKNGITIPSGQEVNEFWKKGDKNKYEWQK